MAKWGKRIVLGLVLLIGAGLVWGYAPDTDPAAMRAKYGGAGAQFIAVEDGLTVHLRDEGPRDAPVLVLLHGSNASLHTWQPWVDRLSSKYRIIRLDQIGHGLTGPDPQGDYSAAEFVRTLDATLARLGVTRFALAGNSMGGWIAWNYTLAHPDKVSRLILIDAGGPPDDPNTQLPLGFRLARTPGIDRLVNVITPRSVFDASVRQSVSNQAIVTPAMVDRYWELNRYPGNREATRLRFAMWRDRARGSERLATITAPTLILWGAEDRLIPVSGAQWFADRIPGVRVIVYPGIGHLPMEEAAARSAADVDAFLQAGGSPR